MARIAIVGSGPAGLIAAHHLAENHEVSIFERGESLKKRTSVTEGAGGAGSTSDGKFTLGTEVGNSLFQILGREKIDEEIRYMDRLYMDFGAPAGRVKEAVFPEEFNEKCRANGFSIRKGGVRHWGTDNGPRIVGNIIESLVSRGVQITYNSENALDSFNAEEGVGEMEGYDYVLLALGRSGASSMADLYHRTQLPHIPGATDIGVRYETSNDVFSEFYKTSYEPKLALRSSFDDPVRLFCACLQDGYVVSEDYPHLINGGGSVVQCVNGHSFTEGTSGNANFSILVTVEFTHPFRDPNSYCCAIAETVNTLAGGVGGDTCGVLVQAFRDLMKQRRSTWKRIEETGIEASLKNSVPGDISFALPYRHLVGIIEFIQALSNIFPGVDNGLMYAPEMKLYSSKALLDKDTLSYTGFHNVFPIGDCSGWTRSLCGASIHGKMVADSINSLEQ